MAESDLPRIPAAHPALKWLLPTAALAVAVGMVVGYPSFAGTLLLGALAGGAALLVATLRPLLGFLVLAFSTMFLMVVVVRPPRGLNAFDVLLLPVLAVSVWGAARRDARRDEAASVGAGHEAIRRAATRFQHAVILYFAVAALSLLPGFLAGRAFQSFDSGLLLLRAVQGVLVYPLALWLLDSERRIHQTIDAILIGGALLIGVNAVYVAAGAVKRAGMTWSLNEQGSPITSPNEAATALIFLTALLLARQAARPQLRNVLMIAAGAVMLILTQSRSGLVAWATFAVLGLRRAGWGRALVAVVLIAALMPLLPHDYLERMGRSLALERGSSERFSIVVRLYGWKAAWKVFLDHPLFGVGYLGFRFVSDRYNDLRFIIPTAENFALETATGMGIVGLAAVGLAIARFYQLGRDIGRVVPPGSLAHQLAHYHGPLITALLVASLTGDVFVGMVALAQLALWNAILIRCGHQALRGAPAA